jgi:hypothetical protein
MSITIEFGRWGLPYLICVGRWEWVCFRPADDAPDAQRRWGIERSRGSEQQLGEVILHCGRIAHCFTRWPKRTPLPSRWPAATPLPARVAAPSAPGPAGASADARREQAG